MADFISESQFDEKVSDVKIPVIRWNELTMGTIYKVTNVITVTAKHGPATVLDTITREGDITKVWAPLSLANKLNGKQLPAFVRPLGLKAHYKDPSMQYHAYDLVFPMPH